MHLVILNFPVSEERMGVKSYLARLSKHNRLFHTMMRKLGVQQTLFDLPHSSEISRRAVQRCMNCAQAGECENLLSQKDTLDTPPTYCSNVALIARLQRLEKASPELGKALLN